MQLTHDKKLITVINMIKKINHLTALMFSYHHFIIGTSQLNSTVHYKS